MTKIARLIAEVYWLAGNHPDAVYVQKRPKLLRCYYTRGAADGGQGCLIGQALLSLYPSLKDTLVGLDKNEPISVLGLFEALGWDEGNGTYWLYEVQKRQDQGLTWSEAVNVEGP
jgi:hypothetical protein